METEVFILIQLLTREKNILIKLLQVKWLSRKFSTIIFVLNIIISLSNVINY